MSRRLFVLLWALLAPLAAFAAESKILSLHLEGAPSRKLMWLVEVRQGDSERFSRVYARGEGELLWQLRTIIPAEVAQVTRYGGDLVTLLGNGDWMIIGQSSGRSLPGGGRIYSIAGDERSLFAMGEVLVAATQPTSAPSAAVEAPATQAATTQATTRPAELGLFQLVHGDWKLIGALPRRAGGSLALGVVDGMPAVAGLEQNRLSLWRFPAGAEKWSPLGSVEASATEVTRILEDGGRVFVYASDKDGGQLLVRDADWLAPIGLPTQSPVRALGLGGGQLRFVYVEGEKIKERRINPRDLQVEGVDAELQLPSPVDVEGIRSWVHWGMMALITLVMIHTYRKRDEYRQVKIDWTKVQLAPFGRRFFAGMVDLVPVIAALMYARVSLPSVETPPDVLQSMAASQMVLLGIGIFLAHTTIVEAITGRSIGKMVTHLRIVRLDGKRPTVMALLIRNLLRVVDLVLWFTLILMLYLPLRQRLGDLAAGTIVVVDREQH